MIRPEDVIGFVCVYSRPASRLGVVSPARISLMDLPQRQTLVPRCPTGPPGPADRHRSRRINPRGLNTLLENPAGQSLWGGGGRQGVESSLRGQRSAGRRCGECSPSTPPGLLRCFHEVSKEVQLRKRQTAEEGSCCANPPTPPEPLTLLTPAAGKPGHSALPAEGEKKQQEEFKL